ncbi:unnamed protein product [Calypogeia fissa]
MDGAMDRMKLLRKYREFQEFRETRSFGDNGAIMRSDFPALNRILGCSTEVEAEEADEEAEEEEEDEEEEEKQEEDVYAELHPGRRVRTYIIGPHNGCHQCVRGEECAYTVDVLDAKSGSETEFSCRVFLVPAQRAEEWLFSSTQGQWQVAADSKASRLIMVALVGNDHENDVSHMKDDISPLVTRFVPLDCRSSGAIDYLTQENRVKIRRTLALVESFTTGPILVEDVAVAPKKSKSRKGSKVELKCYRRLSFRRNPNMIQSEALLVRNGVAGNCKSRGHCIAETINDKADSQKAKAAVFEGLNIDYSFLTSEYHEGMIAAFALIANKMEQWVASKEQIKVMVLGLGAGLLPMFVHNHIPVNDIQVVELDETIGEIAKNHFGFVEDKRMKLQIGDGVVAVEAIAAAAASNSQLGPGSTDCRLHVLMVDTDARDPSNGLSCPAPECLEDSFLWAAKRALLDCGMLIVNVVASARYYHVYSKDQLKKVFAEVYEIEVEKDVNRVLIAMVQRRRCNEVSNNVKDLSKLKKLCARFSSWDRGPNLVELIRSMKRLK